MCGSIRLTPARGTSIDDQDLSKAVGFSSYNHALQMISKLPSLIHSGEIRGHLAIACFEAWYINMRLVSEFFGIGSADKGYDYKAIQYAEFDMSAEDKADLTKVWKISSKYVAHLSFERNPGKSDLKPDYSYEEMIRLVKIVIRVSQSFEKNLESMDDALATMVHVANTTANTQINWLKAPV
jgi:hypothetical protein